MAPPSKSKRPKALVSWSSGKDSAYALHVARRSGEYELRGLLTTLTREYERVSMHGVREALLDLQAEALNLPCHKVLIPAPCPNGTYEEKTLVALKEARDRGITHVIFGDLYLQDIRDYREALLARVDLQCVFPLWLRDTTELSKEMLDVGLRATLTCIDPRVLAPGFAGRAYDRELLSDLPEGVDPCGENGEFHTLVTAGPMFEQALDVEVGDIVERGGFVFADVLPSVRRGAARVDRA